MSRAALRPGCVVLVWATALFGVGFVQPLDVNAEVRASRGRQGLGTLVNGKRGGRCRSGVCSISGGTKAGHNQFHRFGRFDTRGKIRSVQFDVGNSKNVIVGVTSPRGTLINKMIKMSSKANLFWLSPGGIYLGRGAGFVNIPRLNLSTARTLRLGDGVFDA